MPGLIRKLFICAGVNGLVIQAHGPVDHHKTIQIDYKTRQIKAGSVNDGSKHSNEVQLEAHGLIGSLLVHFNLHSHNHEQVCFRSPPRPS